MVQIGVDIEHAVSVLNQNHLVGLPTETVYGLAGNALNEESILRIFKTKNRPQFDPLIAHTHSFDQLEGFVKGIPEKARVLAESFWPGPLTLLLERKEIIPDLLTAGLNRVAIRIPNHPMALDLLQALDYPLAAPSANPFGYVSPTEAQHVANQLGSKIQYILDGGPCSIGLESTIIGFEKDDAIVHRLGGTTLEAIEDLVGEVRIDINQSSNPAAPGMLKSHYSPGKRVIVGDIRKNLSMVDPSTTGIISFENSFGNVAKEIILSPSGSIDEAARNIFGALRSMDEAGIEVVLAEFVPEHGLGFAINDRLRRAAV